MFNVIFNENEFLSIRFSIDNVISVKKNDVAGFLLSEQYDTTNHPLEICMLLTYLPFLHTVVVNDYENERKLEYREIKLIFYASTLICPSPMTMEVSEKIYNYFVNKK